MSDSFGKQAPEDRERLERCLEALEPEGGAPGAAADPVELLLEADLSHGILRALHRELRWLADVVALSAGRAPGEARVLEKEVGLPLLAFRQRMGDVEATFDRMSGLRNELVEHNLGLVLAQVSQFQHLGLPVADLVQEGNAGLLRAAERFDPSRGVGFATYALWWIRHGCVRAVQNHARIVRLPTHQHDALRLLQRGRHTLEQDLGREPTVEEIASELSVAVRKVDELRCLHGSMTSLEAELQGGGAEPGLTLADVLCDPETPLAGEPIDQENLRRAVVRALAALPERERRILLLRYGLAGGPDRSLREIGIELSLSAERVRQLEKVAIGRLRRRLGHLEALLR
jgi:RNA polymerase sigma factor (sigma-70 family)